MSTRVLPPPSGSMLISVAEVAGKQAGAGPGPGFAV